MNHEIVRQKYLLLHPKSRWSVVDRYQTAFCGQYAIFERTIWYQKAPYTQAIPSEDIMVAVLSYHSWRDLRSTAHAHGLLFSSRYAKSQACEHLYGQLVDSASLRRRLKGLSEVERGALAALQAAGGAQHELAFALPAGARLFGDQGYLSPGDARTRLQQTGLRLVTPQHSNRPPNRWAEDDDLAHYRQRMETVV
jgi:hypothetical protein